MGKGKCSGCKTLAEGPEGSISICGCGLYHVRVNAITLHLTVSQFESAARLFKVGLGIVSAQELTRIAKSDSYFSSSIETTLEPNRIVCLQCGESFELVFDQTECLKNDIAQAYGFEMVQHKMEILGYCQWCRSKPL